MQVQPL